MKKLSINYKNIFQDVLDKKYPNKKKDCLSLLQKNHLSAIDIMEINKRIFGTTREKNRYNQRHRSYSRSDILSILNYQKKNNMNNIQLANHFNLSRNTVSKWKKMFLV